MESNPIGVHPNRNIVYSSMYQSLRINLPREIMGFRDYLFAAKEEDEDRDSRRFTGHREVLKYLNDFAGEFGICEMVRFETEVVFVGLMEGGKWMVKSKSKRGEDLEEIYDAVVVCNGHSTEPRVAQIEGTRIQESILIMPKAAMEPEAAAVIGDELVVASCQSEAGDDSEPAGGATGTKRKRESGSSSNNPCRSQFWEHFDKFDVPIQATKDGEEVEVGHTNKARCKYCQTEIGVYSGYSVDNAAANKHAVEYLRKKMMNWSVPPILDGHYMHVRCLAHILNLIVRSSLNILDKSVAIIRNAVRYVRYSASRLDEFKMCVEKEKLDVNKICILDVPTQWKSTFLMLDTAMQLRKGFDRLAEEEDSKYSGYFGEDEDLIKEDLEVVEIQEDAKSKTRRKRVGPPTDEEWEKAADDMVCWTPFDGSSWRLGSKLMWFQTASLLGPHQLMEGKQIHSHNYRTSEPFRDQVCLDQFLHSVGTLDCAVQSFQCDPVVVLIGSSASAIDISRDIAGVVKEVHIASRSSIASETSEYKLGFHTMWLNCELRINSGYDNMRLHSMIKSVHEDGSVVFADGSVVVADTILHCTGYKYHFPFLETNGIVTVDGDDNRWAAVQACLPTCLCTFAFFCWATMEETVPFPNFELQSKWIAGVLSNRIALPSKGKMMEDVKAFYSSLEASGKPKRHTHDISDSRGDYADWLAAQCRCPVFEEWRKQMMLTIAKNYLVRPKTYQDEWDDNHLVLQAYKDFKKFTTHGV
ncbi:putative transcription factor/ chromatin remodeling BED-type(Zn) family [Rosa chinensis]|uniref:Flavin-containing monooxygenase n=1 Tax=Rosa chinensis TaxID=74649 RepID=A0A2P6P882_ROSCH|nr:putative transcription factor/ chromatin remodeling BED-type(Zn) family [Rosa chinensis]